MIVTDRRLQELAEAPLEDYHDVAEAVQHLAIAILERGLRSELAVATNPTPAPGFEPQLETKRLPGKPLGDKLTHPCSRCGADVVTFISRKSGKPYSCDVEIGMYKNARTGITAANWFHKCQKGGRG